MIDRNHITLVECQHASTKQERTQTSDTNQCKASIELQCAVNTSLSTSGATAKKTLAIPSVQHTVATTAQASASKQCTCTASATCTRPTASRPRNRLRKKRRHDVAPRSRWMRRDLWDAACTSGTSGEDCGCARRFYACCDYLDFPALVFRLFMRRRCGMDWDGIGLWVFRGRLSRG